MATLDYVVLDGYRYVVQADSYRPESRKSQSTERSVTGKLIVTEGVSHREWRLRIRVPYTSTSPWGNLSTLRASWAKQAVSTHQLAFTDPLQSSYTVYLIGEFREENLIPILDSSENKFFVDVQLMEV